MDIKLEDTLLSDFSSNAKEKLAEQTKAYANELISEARLLEEEQRESDAHSEITGTIIMRAAMVKKMGIERKTPMGLKLCRVASVITCAVSGFLFDSNGYEGNLIKLISFILVFAIACITTVIMFVKEK